jgi:hypothetical protein
VEVKGIRITGNRTSANVQNAFVFYDRADFIFMQDVDVFDMTGRALYSRVLRRTSQSFMRESHFNSAVRRVRQRRSTRGRFRNGPSTNEIGVDGLDIIAPAASGLSCTAAAPGWF